MTALLLPLILAAPAPAPRHLTAELLVGRWQWDWGMMRDGWIQFEADGHYFSRHTPGEEPEYAGFWSLRGNVLTLHEGRLREGEPLNCTADYPVRLDMSDYPVIRGSYFGTDVVLRR